ncbi:MAG: hypothetical protein MH472_04445, partial [Bacteroidia bacterium]|nr:hypothetical protein [Bacteroidia bacterium]
MLGIDKDGNDLSCAQREAYKNKAIDILEHCDPKSFYNAFYWENQQYRAKELIMYLQAFDYLRTLHEYYGYPMSLTQIENIEDELAEFTKSLHGRANNWLGNYGKMNNLTILTAAATGMAAVVLHGRTAMFFLPQKHPKRWANAAHFYISRSLWNHDKQQSKKGEIGPFADGPSYFEYAFESAIPFFISWDLFLGGKDHTGSYDESLLFSGTESVRNYMYDENYDNLYQWYNEIRMPNSFPPTNDDCWQSENFSALGIARTKKALKKGFTYDAFEPDDYEKMELRGATGLNLAPDYLLALIPTDKRLETKESVNLYSGDIIVRTNKQDGLSNQHYLHVNAEKNEALNAHRILGTGHEHGDALNLIVSSGEDILIFDPSYLGYENRGKINKGKHHNIITSDNSVFGELEPNPGASEVKVLKFETSENYDLIELEIQYTKGLTYGTTINRTIEVVKQYYLPFGKKMPQYHITDRIKNNSIFSAVNTFRLNGNGNSDDNPSTFIQHSNKKFEWNHPCFKDENNLDNWKIFAYIDIPGSSEVNIENDNAHGTFSTRLNYNPDETLLSGQTHICQGNSPKHSQIEISKHTSSYESIIIKTTLLPTPCQNNPVEPKKTKLDSRFTSQLFEFPHENDTLLNYHFSNEADSLINDKNPFGLSDSNIQITSDAKSIFFSYSSNPFFKSGTCISNLNFRKLKMQHGKSLIYHDTTYLNANKNIDFFYEIIGKCKYRAFSACDSETTIDVFIPDGILGQDMTVKNPEITSTYNDTSRVLTLQLPTGLSQFEIELTDPCLVSCYFPSTSETIHETFDFNEGITATLGHKLDIVQPTGLLNITNGSHMQICNGIYLRNRDSLVLYSGCGKDTGQLSITTCDGSGTGAVSAAMEGTGGGAKASKISVMSGGVLILDSNSVTQISNNSELHVWGTLVIKAGATLVIGDGRKCSYASIMVYPGAYVHIEDEAHLEFFKIVGDTQDRHVFFVSKLPTAASAIKGVAPSIVNLLLTDTILTGSETPVELCDLYTVTPDHGIANREWGFSNILKPKADIWVPNDTICQGECLLIDFSASLNDPIRSLEVCRIDTLFGLASEVCFGSMRIEGMQLTQGYNESSECYYSEASLKMFPLCNYIDSGNAWYKIFVKVENHCGIEDTQSVYFFVAKKPSALLALADTLACGGYGTVKAYNYSLVNAEKATYHVHVIDTTQYQDGDENRFFYGADWELYNLHYGDSFEFPDFNWQGGFTYAVSLTQYGWCGESNTSWDTINIQPGAVILASPASVYSNPLGPSALQLQGYVGNADYYTWSPTTDLDNPYVLNPIATPTDTITYILSAFKGSCEAHDTLFVRHNTLAYAGPADTICAGESIILGTSFDASLFLGYQFYENHLVLDEINERLGIDINFFSKLSLYLLSNAGKTALNSCVNYSTFLSTLNREQFYQEPWYAAYLEAFSNTYDFDDAFSLFVSGVNNNGTL